MSLEIGAERRQVTVLFCDLVGSTQLSSRIDPEEYSELVQDYQRRAVEIARQFGGEAEAYSGDGILCRFGWPEAHEDDAERALRAALALVETFSGDIVVRVGVHSGVVVVGEMGAPGSLTTIALGETMNLAARLQGEAAPGTVVTSAATLALVRGRFAVRDLGPRLVKGIDRPVETFLVEAPHRVAPRLADAPGGLTPFVGRRNELEEIDTRWRSAVSGNGSAILLLGEPGVGKSRLLQHTRERLAGTPHLWLDASCSAYTQMSSLWPVIQLIEQELQLQADKSPEVRLRRLRQGLAAAGLTRNADVALMAQLMSIPGLEVPAMSGERRRDRTIELLRTWLAAVTEPEPLVLVVEDLHWADPTSLDVIGALLDDSADLKLLLFLTARPEFVPPWETSEQRMALIALEPLPDDDIRDVVTALGGHRSLPQGVVDRIVGSAAGIPLFAEEIGRSVIESGVLVAEGERWELERPAASLEIPRTLQSSLLARLDRLGPAKAVAQVAAVIGRSFSFELLAAVSGMQDGALRERLASLVASDLVFADSTAPAPGYVFKHALVQEIAYDSLLRRTRRVVHERIATALLENVGSGANVALEVVARHFEAAGSLREACEQYLLAATESCDRSAYREAIEFLRRSLSLLDGVAGEPWRVDIEIETRLALCSAVIATSSYSDPEIEVEYAKVRDLCEDLGNEPRVGYALAGLSIFHTNRGRTSLGAELAQRVLEIADAHGDDTLELLGRVQLALPRSYQGRPTETLGHSLRAIEVYDEERHRVISQRFGTDHGVAAHAFAGWACLVQGYLDRGMAYFEKGVALAERLAHPFDLAFALAFRATAHWERGEGVQTEDSARRARELAEEQGFALWAGVSGVWEIAERVIRTGDTDAVPSVLAASMVAAESGNRGGSTTVMARVAEACRATHDLDMAWALVDLALSVGEETGEIWWDSALHRMRAELLFEAASTNASALLGGQGGSFEEAEKEWLEALSLADALGYPVHGARAAAGYAALLDRRGQTDRAKDLLRSWYARCPEGHDTPVLTRIRSTLESLGNGSSAAMSRTPDSVGSAHEKPRSG